jgi:hypothetical protein
MHRSFGSVRELKTIPIVIVIRLSTFIGSFCIQRFINRRVMSPDFVSSPAVRIRILCYRAATTKQLIFRLVENPPQKNRKIEASPNQQRTSEISSSEYPISVPLPQKRSNDALRQATAMMSGFRASDSAAMQGRSLHKIRLRLLNQNVYLRFDIFSKFHEGFSSSDDEWVRRRVRKFIQHGAFSEASIHILEPVA